MAMCRIFGCVAADAVSIRHELLDADNPMIRQAEEHDSGWGMAVYERADGVECKRVRFPEAAHMDDGFLDASKQVGQRGIGQQRVGSGRPRRQDLEPRFVRALEGG